MRSKSGITEKGFIRKLAQEAIRFIRVEQSDACKCVQDSCKVEFKGVGRYAAMVKKVEVYDL